MAAACACWRASAGTCRTWTSASTASLSGAARAVRTRRPAGPEALAAEPRPPGRAGRPGWSWCFLPEARALGPAARAGALRPHVRDSGLHKAVKRAAERAGLDQQVGGQP